jgi:hypothetical protein
MLVFSAATRNRIARVNSAPRDSSVAAPYFNVVYWIQLLFKDTSGMLGTCAYEPKGEQPVVPASLVLGSKGERILTLRAKLGNTLAISTGLMH